MTNTAIPSRATTLAQVSRVLLSAWQARRNRGSLWVWALIGALAALVPLVTWQAAPARSRIQVVLAVSAGMMIAVLVVAWASLVFNVLLQNHPRIGRIVPGQVLALRLTLWSGLAFASVLGAVASAAAGGPFLLTFACMAVGFAAMAVCVRWPPLWLALSVVTWSAPLWGDSDEIRLAVLAWQSQPWIITLIALGLAALVPAAIVMNGNERHVRADARLRAMSASFQGRSFQLWRRPAGGTSWAWQERLGLRVYSAWMRHLLARPNSSTRARLALGTGAQTHWSGLVTGAPFALLILLALMAANHASPEWATGRRLLGGSVMGLVMVTFMMPLQIPKALWSSRREQAVLRLLPGAPQGASLNRWLAIRFALLQLSTVMALTAVVLLVIANTKVAPEWTSLSSIALCALVLSLLLIPTTLWRDWSRLRAPTGFLQVALVALIVAIAGVATAWVMWLKAPGWLLVALTIVALLPLCVWRWRAIEAAPAAWPVGRA